MIAYQKGACFSDLECLKFQHQSTINTSTLNQMITAGKLSLFNLIELPLSVWHTFLIGRRGIMYHAAG